MSKSFSWSLSTPNGQVAHGECELLVVPTALGEMGVLADHAALVACVTPGELRVTTGAEVRSYPVGPGLVEVRDNSVSLLVSSVPTPTAPRAE